MEKKNMNDWDGDHNKAWNPETERFEKINTFWDKIKWKLFGETRLLYWIFLAPVILTIFFYFFVLFIGIHFLTKFW